MPDRAISEALGYVLIFAIILATIAVVYATGFESLGAQRDGEQLQNAERAFEVLADNMQDMSHRNAPSRATEIKLSDATITMGEPVSFNVSVRDSQEFTNTTFRPIIYRKEGGDDLGRETNEIIYSNGAIMRGSDPGSAIVRDPSISLGGDKTAIVLTRTTIPGTTPPSVSGSKTVLVRGDVDGQSLTTMNTSGSLTVFVNVTSSRADVWADYFDRTQPGSDACPGTDGKVCWEFTTDRLYVTVVKITTSID